MRDGLPTPAMCSVHVCYIARCCGPGAGAEGAALLQHWLDASGDVQSAALLAARCFTPELLALPHVQHWLDRYRALPHTDPHQLS